MQYLYKKKAKQLMNANELSRKYSFGHFLLWNSVLKSLPRDWIETLNKDKPWIENERAEIYDALQNTNKTAKWSYPILLKTCKITFPENAQRKWENDLNTSDVAWKKVYKYLYETTNDVKLKWLQLRILHRILPTNRALNIYRIKDSGKCERCSDPSETILHVFWSCKYVKEFWRQLRIKLSLARHPTAREIILGIGCANGALAAAPLRICMLLGKEFIWQCKHAGTVPDVERFFIKLCKYIAVERCIASYKGKMKKYCELYGDLIRVIEL